MLLGEDIAGDFGGAFKVTRGFEAELGAHRVTNTPIAELGFTGMATGMALMGLRPVVEMPCADFISCAFDSIVQFASTAHYRAIGAVPWVRSARRALVRRGDDVSLVTYGAQLREAIAAAERLAAEQIECDVLDLRTLKPLDVDAILESARRTGKVLVVHAANRLAGVGAEVAAIVSDQAFEWLDAPVRRLCGLDTPVPFSPPLEDAYRPNAATVYDAAKELARY